MKESSSKQLQKRLILTSGISIFTVSTFVALISILPLYNQLKEGENRTLKFALETRTMTVEEFLSRAEQITLQITSRTKIRELLEKYNNQQLSLGEIVVPQTTILGDSLNQSEEVVGIVRLDANNQVVTEVGSKIPRQLWLIPEQNSEEVLISDPIKLGSEFYLVLGAAIRNPHTKQRVGTDIVLFQGKHLENIITNHGGLGKTGDINLISWADNQVELFFLPSATQNLQETTIKNKVQPIHQDLRKENFSTISLSDASEIFLINKISKINWYLIITIDKQELYASINNQFSSLGFIILSLGFLGSLGMIILLRPLAGRMILNTEELELKIQENTEDLKEKIQEKNFAIQELQQTQKQLLQAEKLSSLGQMLAGIAHEINNPINFVHGNISPLEDYTQDILKLITLYQNKVSDSKIEDFTEEIDFEFLQEDLPQIICSMKLGTERIQQIILGLRNFARIDESQLKQIDIHQELETSLLILNYRIKHEIEVLKKYSDLPKIFCYPAQINQVFMNLLTNGLDAIEDSNKEAKKLCIETEKVTEETIKIKIKDNGSGIPVEIREKVFNSFFTTKSIGKGTGLGLSICSQIVAKHKGTIEVFSQLGEGTEFVIILPVNLTLTKE